MNGEDSKNTSKSLREIYAMFQSSHCHSFHSVLRRQQNDRGSRHFCKVSINHLPSRPLGNDFHPSLMALVSLRGTSVIGCNLAMRTPKREASKSRIACMRNTMSRGTLVKIRANTGALKEMPYRSYRLQVSILSLNLPSCYQRRAPQPRVLHTTEGRVSERSGLMQRHETYLLESVDTASAVGRGSCIAQTLHSMDGQL